MDKRPIGIFDSGVGGLTVAKEIMEQLPGETIVYLGDTANLPYGDKSTEIVRGYAVANTKFLMGYDIKALVVACNTASSVALDYLKDNFDIPIIGVIEPAAKGALYATRNRSIGVIGTNRTIKSDVYRTTLLAMDKDAQVYSKACPLFVPLIEENFADHAATKLIAGEYLAEFRDKGVDTLILGCTHYPLIKDVIAAILPDVKLVDSAYSTAKDLYSILDGNRMLNTEVSAPAEKRRFYATDITEKLNLLAQKILGMPVEFQEVTLK